MQRNANVLGSCNAGWILKAARIVACGLFASLACLSSARARDYYVDFVHGDDGWTGQSSERPWKHAPGDGAAEGEAARIQLKAGDRVLFRSGVAYRGSINLNASGESRRPIEYLGSAWGPDRATISGFDEISVKPRSCKEAPECPAAFRSPAYSVIDLPMRADYTSELRVGTKLLHVAQSSATGAAPARAESEQTFYSLTPSMVTKDGEWVHLRSPDLSALLGSSDGFDVTGFVWSFPNLVYYPVAASYDPQSRVLNLRIPTFVPYDKRNMAFAIVNHPSLLKRPDEFVTLAEGRKLLMLTEALPKNGLIEISTRENGINLRGRSHIVVDGFLFEGVVGGPTGVGGSSILNTSASSDVTISRNRIADTASYSRSAAIGLSFIENGTIRSNEIEGHLVGRGISLYKSDQISISANTIRDLTYTGILVITSKNVEIDHNRISNVNGVHGNGVSIYLGNQRVRVRSNQIWHCVRPFTFKGAKDNVPLDLEISRNLIWASGRDSRAALQSWGDEAIGVKIVSNILLADEGVGLDLRDADRRVTIRNNLMDGVTYGRMPLEELASSGNVFTRNAKGTAAVLHADVRPEMRRLATEAFSDGKVPSSLCGLLNGAPGKSSDPAENGGIGVFDEACKASRDIP